METGIVNICELYNYIKKNKDIPHRSNDKIIYKPFKALIDKSICHVPKKTGWYYWIDINNVKRSIYIGKSDSNTTYNLYKRIEEELSEEYLALWATVYDEQEVLERFSSKYNYKYNNNHKRALKKKGVTHILWVSLNNHLDKHEIDVIESKLINHFKPVANHQKKDLSHCYSDLYDKIENKFYMLIHTIVA